MSEFKSQRVFNKEFKSLLRGILKGTDGLLCDCGHAKHLAVAGEDGCTLASGIMMAHWYLSTIMGSEPVKPHLAIWLLHYTPRPVHQLCITADYLNKNFQYS